MLSDLYGGGGGRVDADGRCAAAAVWRQVLRGKELKYYERVEDSADNMKGKLSGNYGRPYEVPPAPPPMMIRSLGSKPPPRMIRSLRTLPGGFQASEDPSGLMISSLPSAREGVVEIVERSVSVVHR